MVLNSKKILVVGGGYVGLVSAVCWAKLGHHVLVLEKNSARVQALQQGQAPFFEPELDILLQQHLNKNLWIFDDFALAMRQAPEFIFLCVGTPANADGSADLSQVWQAIEELCLHVKFSTVLVCKSTMPVGTTKKIQSKIQNLLQKDLQDIKIDVVFMPEFLSQGQAIQNFLHPDRVVLGLENFELAAPIKELHGPLLENQNNFFVMDFASAELVKYAANAMLATRISFMNEVANFAEKVGGNIDAIAQAVGADPRIGKDFLAAGIGFGGSCFPKDLAAFVSQADQFQTTAKIAAVTLAVNIAQRQIFLKKILAKFPNLSRKKIGLLGLAFKSGTDDLRESPGLWLMHEFLSRGATVLAFDPLVNPIAMQMHNLFMATNFAELLQQDFLVIANKYEFLEVIKPEQFLSLRDQCIFDGRNCFDKNYFLGTQIQYFSIG